MKLKRMIQKLPKIKLMQYVKWLKNQIQCICKNKMLSNNSLTCNWICLQKENKQIIIRIMFSMMIGPILLDKIVKNILKQVIQFWQLLKQKEELINK
jgi:hypothetical protein